MIWNHTLNTVLTLSQALNDLALGLNCNIMSFHISLGLFPSSHTNSSRLSEHIKHTPISGPLHLFPKMFFPKFFT